MTAIDSPETVVADTDTPEIVASANPRPSPDPRPSSDPRPSPDPRPSSDQPSQQPPHHTQPPHHQPPYPQPPFLHHPPHYPQPPFYPPPPPPSPYQYFHPQYPYFYGAPYAPSPYPPQQHVPPAYTPAPPPTPARNSVKVKSNSHNKFNIGGDVVFGGKTGSEKRPRTDEQPEAGARRFRKKAKSMFPSSSRWVLKATQDPERSVEDILSAHVSRRGGAPEKNLAASFILDVSDDSMRVLFTPEEWAEIVECVPALPAAEEITGPAAAVSGVKTLHDLRSLVKATLSDEPDATKDWLLYLYTHFLHLYSYPDPSPVRQEVWFDIKYWNPIFDACFTTDAGLTVDRGEVPSRASQARLNRRRRGHNGRRVVVGPKYDALFRQATGDVPLELGATEVGREFAGVHASKWRGDFLKLGLVMRDMLVRINKFTKGSKVLDTAVVVGVLCGGPVCQSLRMVCPKGNVCLLVRDSQLEVPAGVVEFARMAPLVERAIALRTVLVRTNELTKGLHLAPERPRFIGWTWDAIRTAVESEEEAGGTVVYLESVAGEDDDDDDEEEEEEEGVVV